MVSLSNHEGVARGPKVSAVTPDPWFDKLTMRPRKLRSRTNLDPPNFRTTRLESHLLHGVVGIACARHAYCRRSALELGDVRGGQVYLQRPEVFLEPLGRACAEQRHDPRLLG